LHHILRFFRKLVGVSFNNAVEGFLQLLGGESMVEAQKNAVTIKLRFLPSISVIDDVLV